MDEPCCVCGSPALAWCSRCHAVAYCGPDCQRAHWKSHRPLCGRAAAAVAGTGGTDQAVGPPAPTHGAGPPCGGGGSLASRAVPGGGDAPSFAPLPGPMSGLPGDPAGFDVVLHGERSVENAQRVVDALRDRGVCVVKAGADRAFQKALHIESRLLWDSGEFSAALKGRPAAPGVDDIRYDSRDDKIVWMTKEWTEKNERKCKALKVLDGQLGDFGFGLKQLLEEQLGLQLRGRSPGMLACYAGDEAPGAKYDFHVDNPFQTVMEAPDDRRRLTVIYYISDAARGAWDVKEDGGALQVCLTDPRRALRTAAEAVQHPKLTVAPECDTIAVFFAHTMYHAVLPVLSSKRRFALSTWFYSGAEE